MSVSVYAVHEQWVYECTGVRLHLLQRVLTLATTPTILFNQKGIVYLYTYPAIFISPSRTKAARVRVPDLHTPHRTQSYKNNTDMHHHQAMHIGEQLGEW